jgi:DNA-binding protein H-NS
MTSYRDVKAKITKLEKQAQDLFKKEVATVIAKIQGLMQEYGLTPDDLAGRVKAFKDYKAPKAAAKKTKVAKPAGIPKYRDPVSGKTWTGHGKAPTWIAAAVKAGKKDDFLITKAAAPAIAAKAPSKVVAKKPAAKPVAITVAKITKKPVVKPATKPAAKQAAPKAAATKPAPTKVAVKKPVIKKAAAKPAPVAPATPA